MSRKTVISVGSRIRHNTDKFLSEGVVVFINTEYNKPYSVHWNNNKVKKGYYSFEELSKINPISVLKDIKKEIEQDV
jgi:hypothetical protein